MLKGWGLTDQEVVFLGYLSYERPTTVREIQEKYRPQSSRHSRLVLCGDRITKILRSLMAKGYVSRRKIAYHGYEWTRIAVNRTVWFVEAPSPCKDAKHRRQERGLE